MNIQVIYFKYKNDQKNSPDRTFVKLDQRACQTRDYCHGLHSRYHFLPTNRPVYYCSQLRGVFGDLTHDPSDLRISTSRFPV